MEGDGEVEMFVDTREAIFAAVVVVVVAAVVVGVVGVGVEIDLAFRQGSKCFASHGWT